MGLDDYGALIQSGMNLVPDVNRQMLERAQTQAIGAQTQQDQAQTAALIQKQNRAKLFQQDLKASDGSPQAVSHLIMKYPELADELTKGFDVQDKAARDADLTTSAEIYSAANSGNWELAKKLAHERADAEKAAGHNDPTYDAAIESMDKAAAGDKTEQKGVLNLLGTHLAAVTGAEHFGTVYGALKGGYTMEAGGARFDDNNNMVAHSPFIKDADGNIRLWSDTGSASPAQTSTSTPPPAQGGFDNAVATVLKNEGGYNPKDMNGAPVNFGINQKANEAELKKLGVANVKDLTRDQAMQIYKDKYWDGSGAESLPANLQTPYFDVYIRNEKVAKQALDASGGDPQKFMQLSNAYFQSLAAKTGTQGSYGRAWANRDKNNLAIATGQAAPETAAPAAAASTAATERFPIVIPGSSPDQYRTLTPAEVKTRGLDASQQYQLNTKTGALTGLGKIDAADQPLPGDETKSGPSYLATIPPNMATQVKALAEGRLPMPSSFALAKPYWQRMLQMTAQYDPTFDAANAPARKAAITAFTGNGKAAQIIGSVNRVANHLDLLWNESKRLAGPETGWSVTNSLLAGAGQSFEPQDAKAYDNEVGFVAGELGKIAKAGVVTEGEISRIISNLGRKNSASTRDAAIKAAVGIISGAVDPLKDQYNSAFTNGSTRPNIPWVSPKAQQVYRKIGGVDLNLTDQNAGSNTSESGATSAPVQVSSPQEAARLPSGTLFITPDGRTLRKK